MRAAASPSRSLGRLCNFGCVRRGGRPRHVCFRPRPPDKPNSMAGSGVAPRESARWTHSAPRDCTTCMGRISTARVSVFVTYHCSAARPAGMMRSGSALAVQAPPAPFCCRAPICAGAARRPCAPCPAHALPSGSAALSPCKGPCSLPIARPLPFDVCENRPHTSAERCAMPVADMTLARLEPAIFFFPKASAFSIRPQGFLKDPAAPPPLPPPHPPPQGVEPSALKSVRQRPRERRRARASDPQSAARATDSSKNPNAFRRVLAHQMAQTARVSLRARHARAHSLYWGVAQMQEQ